MYFSVLLHILALASATITIAIPLTSDKAGVQIPPSSPLIPRTNMVFDDPGRLGLSQGSQHGHQNIAPRAPHERGSGFSSLMFFDLNARLAEFKTPAEGITGGTVKDADLQQAIDKMKSVVQGIREFKSGMRRGIKMPTSNRGQEFEKSHPGALETAISQLDAVMDKVHELAADQKDQQKREKSIADIKTSLQAVNWTPIKTK